MADWTVLQAGDLVDAANTAALVGMSNLGDHVEDGLEFQNLNWTDGTFNVTRGKAILLLDELYATNASEYRQLALQAAHLDPVTGVTFDTGAATNYVYVNFNVGTQDSPSIETTTSPVSTDDWLKIAELDTTAEEVTRVNESPDASFGDVSIDSLSVAGAITYGDGTTRSGAPLTAGSTLDNRNDYYDNQAANPPGVVAEAAHAQTADSAMTAQSATTADTAATADTADEVGDLSQSDIESLIDASGGEWTTLTDPALTDTDANSAIDIDWTASQTYDRLKVALYLENHHDGDVNASIQVNNHTRQNYHQTKAVANIDDKSIKNLGPRTEWDVASALPNAFGFSEFEVICPTPEVAPDYHQPVMALQAMGAGKPTSIELSGHLAKSITSIDSIQLQTTADATGRVVIKGQDIL